MGVFISLSASRFHSRKHLGVALSSILTGSYHPGVAYRKYGGEHQRQRRAFMARLRDGDPCSRCGEAMTRDMALELDHDEDGSYLGLSHRICNRRAAGIKSAILAGKTVGDIAPTRRCVVCGVPIRPSSKATVCCTNWECIALLKRSRKEHRPDPLPPAAAGRTW
jgi:predicted nucleic acid-binding Zn ribbon protein